MSDIFLSYARNDLHRVKPLIEALEAEGLSVWWDRKVAPGKSFEEVIDAAIESASCVLVLWTEQSVTSDWVRTEATEGLEKGILLPVLLDEVRVPLSFRRVQAANLVGWAEDPESSHYDELIQRIRELVPAEQEKQPGVIAEVPIVGRGAELEVLEQAMRKSMAGTGGVVLVSGQPGIGKTHLVRAFATRAEAMGAVALFGNCYDTLGSPAYWPWIQLLESAARRFESSELASVLGDEGSRDVIDALLPDQPDAGETRRGFHDDRAFQARFRLFSRVTDYLGECAEQKPLLLVMDNIHSADAASLAVLEFLARRLTYSPMLLLATYRDVDVSRKDPLFNTLSVLSQELELTRLRLDGLKRADAADIVEQTVGRDVAGEVIDAIYEQTEGNPLFVREVAQGLADELNKARGKSIALRIPDGIREAIGRRLNQLSERCNEILSVASVIGREFELREITSLMDVDAVEVLQALEPASAAGIVNALETGIGRFIFGHTLIRDTLYDELPMARRLLLHRQVAEMLERAHANNLDPALAQIAQHYYRAAQSGCVDKAVEFALKAAGLAQRKHAHEEGIELCRMALDALSMDGAELRGTEAEIYMKLADCQYGVGRSAEEISASYEAAMRAARQAGHHECFLEAAWAYVPQNMYHSGERPLQVINEALELLTDGNDRARARTLAHKAVALGLAGHRSDAVDVGYESVELARKTGDPALIAETMGRVVWVMRTRPEKLSERIRLGEEALAIAGRPDDLYARVEVERWLALSHQEAGNTQRVRELAVMFRGDAEQNGVLLYRYIAAGIDAFLALLEGRWEEAEGFIRKAAELGQGSGDLATEGVAGAQFMMLTRELGRLKALEPALRQFTDDPLTHPWGPAIAAVFIELGAIDEARDVFERMAKAGFANLPKDELYLTTLTFMAETCVALEDSKRAAELYQGLLPYAGQMVVQPTAVCYGPDDLYLGMLAELMNQPADAEQHFARARDLAEHAESSPWLAHALFRYGSFRRRQGESDDGMLDEARRIAESLSMARLLELVDAADAVTRERASRLPDDLTPREVEVLRLIAAGRSNKDIATALFISLNTVATHVRSILNKTHTANRTEAAAYAMQQGLND
jgi:DNA-binding CsgD family transcriptional regulator/tetratricopeptide (TPR) repeat protein